MFLRSNILLSRCFYSFHFLHCRCLRRSAPGDPGGGGGRGWWPFIRCIRTSCSNSLANQRSSRRGSRLTQLQIWGDPDDGSLCGRHRFCCLLGSNALATRLPEEPRGKGLGIPTVESNTWVNDPIPPSWHGKTSDFRRKKKVREDA